MTESWSPGWWPQYWRLWGLLCLSTFFATGLFHMYTSLKAMDMWNQIQWIAEVCMNVKNLGIWSPLFTCNAVVGRMLYSFICRLNAVNIVFYYMHCRVQLCPSSMKIHHWERNMYLIFDVHAVKYMTMQGGLCIRILEMVEYLRFHCHRVRVILATRLLEEEVSMWVTKTAPVISVWFNGARYLSEVWNGIVAFYFKCVI